jgi:hypothetical protein
VCDARDSHDRGHDFVEVGEFLDKQLAPRRMGTAGERRRASDSYMSFSGSRQLS